MMKKTIRIGTRESLLAKTQSGMIASKLAELYPSYGFELVPMTTKGDRILGVKLDKIGGKGLFVKELEDALLNGAIDMAVHSVKDMPAALPDALMFAVVTDREDARDALITGGSKALEELGDSPVIGTSSLRREIQMLALKPGSMMKTLRGNVPTRLDKLDRGDYQAIILAAAGLFRLELQNRINRFFSIEEMVPAVGQGALAVEIRKEDSLHMLLAPLQNHETMLAIQIERSMMIALNGNCSTPLGAHAVIEGKKVKLYGFLGREGTTGYVKDILEDNLENASALGERMAERLAQRLEKLLGS